MIKKQFFKMGLCHLTKTFFIHEVTENNFLNSPLIENVGFLSVFKVDNKKDYKFRLKELKRLGYELDEVNFLNEVLVK